MATVDVLIPHVQSPIALAALLTSLNAQSHHDFTVTVSLWGADREAVDTRALATILRALEWHGHEVRVVRRPLGRTMAEHRHALLLRCTARYVQILAGDILLDPSTQQRMVETIRDERCGFAGCSAADLQRLEDFRPHEQHIDLWERSVEPEDLQPGSLPVSRLNLHSGANLLHLERHLAPDGRTVCYRVAWLGGDNVLYDRAHLLAVGGLMRSSDPPLPPPAGDAIAQLLLLRSVGGCGILPTGTYHLGAPREWCLPQDHARELVRALRMLDITVPIAPREAASTHG